MKRVSVILPVHNVEAFLPQSLDSILLQDEPSVEIVAVDDCSTDGSTAVLADYRERYPETIRIVTHDTNRGPGGARNSGIEAARGEYITFVDPDDYLDPRMLSSLLAAAGDRGAGLVACGYEKVDRTGAHLGFVPADTAPEGPPSPDSIRARLISTQMHPWAKLIRRDVFEDSLLRFPERVYRAEDLAVMPFVAAESGTYAVVNEPLYKYRCHASQVTVRRNYERNLDGMTAADRFLSTAVRLGYLDEFRPEIEARFVGIYYYHTLKLLLKVFDRVDIDLVRRLRSRVGEEFPDYRKSPVFRQSPAKVRAITLLCDMSPHLFKAVHSVTSWRYGRSSE